jgi:DNA polymerase III epsilon subunit-like protein
MDSTVVVLDLETNGLLSGGFVQPLQIGVVRHALDEEGCISPNEMSAVLLPVKLLPDFTVAPDAQALTGLDGAVGRTEYEVAQLLHAALNAPKTTVIAGYNIASFDNTVLRFMFWRNGLPVYTHERRVVDVFPMVAAMAALGLGLVALPENGGLKLEHIAEANDNFGVEGDAHNALFDTRVTVALLMRLMSDATMKTIEDANFDTFREYRAMAAWPRLGKGNYPYGRFAAGWWKDTNFQASAIRVAQHRKHQEWLRLDVAPLSDVEDWRTLMFSRKAGAGGALFPASLGYEGTFNREIVKGNLEWLRANLNKFHAFANEFVTPSPMPWAEFANEIDADERLYVDPFLNQSQLALWREFHKATWHERPSIALKMVGTQQELAKRIICRNAPAVPPELRPFWETHMKNRPSAKTWNRPSAKTGKSD